MPGERFSYLVAPWGLFHQSVTFIQWELQRCFAPFPLSVVRCMQVAERCGVHVSAVKNVTIWGNHSSTQYPDVNHGTVNGKPIRQAIGDDAWLDGDFVATVQQRGAAIIKVRSGAILAGQGPQSASSCSLSAPPSPSCPEHVCFRGMDSGS